MRWLHLCDLHIGKTGESQANAMSQLVSAIDAAGGKKALDLVLFTGDLAFSGKSDEYTTLARDLIGPLRKLSITKYAQFVAVPGNHDLDCDSTLPIIWSGLGKARQEEFWNFDDHGQRLRSNRASGFEAYTNFMQAENILGLDPTHEPGSWIDIQTAQDKKISLVCLNTALFSDKLLSDEAEKGKAPLPVQTLRSLTRNNQVEGLVIVLGHHPVEWFEKQSMHHFLSALKEFGAIYLHGHKHEIEARFSSHSLSTLGFGAAYPTQLEAKSAQPYTSTFAVCELDDLLHLKFVAWEPDYGEWRPFHKLHTDFERNSSILSGGYEIPVPTTKATSTVVREKDRSYGVRTRPQLHAPIWIEGNYADEWTSLLVLLGLITPPYKITRQSVSSVETQFSFLVEDKDVIHLIHAASAETSIVTYDHVESVNTQIDTLKLESCIIATFGKISEAAMNLANSLRQTKQIRVLDGAAIAARLSESEDIVKRLASFSNDGHVIVSTPLVAKGGIALLIVDAIKKSWFSIVDVTGKFVDEHGELVTTVREKLPQYKSTRYKSNIGTSEIHLLTPPKPFDRTKYLTRCLNLFDTANYAGLAAMGVRLPIESLRQIYVPTAANVERDRTAIEATNRAIEEMVETLGLDEHQKAQLERQMKASYGIRQTSEANAASGLYHTLSNIVVLGDPGSGKSCFVRTEIMSYCEPSSGVNYDWYAQHVPVFLPLAQYTNGIDDPTSLLDHCVAHAGSQKLDLDRIQLDILLSRGLVALFLDGLDEIGSIAARQRVVEEVRQLVEEFAPTGNRIVLTSRPAAVRDLNVSRKLTKLTLQGLTDAEIELLATKLFQVRYQPSDDLPETDKDVINSILQDCSSKPGIRRLARNPLLLTLLVFIYENSGAFAARRHLIYSQAVKTLVSVRHRDIRSAMLSEADLRTRLGKLAVAIFRRETSALPTRAEVANVLADSISKELEVANNFIQEVAESTGLLLVHPRTANKSEDLVSFMHHSFLEYYTALSFIEEGDGVQLVSEFALNPSWYEIVTLMFGILGEQSDITEGMEILCKQHSDSDPITTGRLELAFDCALECDVPPEATQRLLAREVSSVLKEGPGLFVSEVREGLADKIRILLENTGSKPVKEMLLGGLADENADVAAAYVHLVAEMGSYCNEDEELLSGLSAAFERNERALRLAVVNALRDLPALRSVGNLQTVRSLLQRGGVVEKSAALQLLEEEPSLIRDFSVEVVNILQEEKNPLALTAASCVLRGGISQHQEFASRALLDRALQTVIQSDAPRQSLVGRLNIPWQQLESWIYSEHLPDKQRGFRSLVAVEEDAVKVHDVLFSALKRESESAVLTTILNALSSYPAAIRSASLADTDLVCKLSRSNYGNVRTAAARALRSFATMQVVTDTLIEQFRNLRGRDSKEAHEVIKSLAVHAVHDESCWSELTAELSRFLQKKQKNWSAQRTGVICKLLIACDQAAVKFEANTSTKLMELVSDYRTPVEVRRLSMRLYGQACPTNPESARKIQREFALQDTDRRLAAYRSANRFLRRCRGRIETIQIVQESLADMKAELIICWRREVGLIADKSGSPALQEIRTCLIAIESTLGSYKEFSKRVQADSYAQQLSLDQ